MTTDKKEEFRKKLADLFNEYGLFIGSCGCCGGTFIGENDDHARRYNNVPETFTPDDVESK